jgi:hypothetical protein
MVPDHTYLTQSMHSNLSRSPTRSKQAPTPERNLGDQKQTDPAIVLGHPILPPHDNLRIGKGDFGQVVTQLHHLTSPIYQHMIGTFNTCPREPTHRSLIDIGGGYNLRDVSFLHHTPRPSQLIVLRFHLRAPPGLRLSNLNINL